MALEDAAVLGNLLSRLTSAAHLPFLLKAYQNLRIARTSSTQASSRLNQRIFHLPDGPGQEARDRAMREAMEGELRSQPSENVENPNQWADRRKNQEQFSYDADEVVEEWWKAQGERAIGKLEQSSAVAGSAVQDEALSSGWWNDDDEGDFNDAGEENSDDELDADQWTITEKDEYGPSSSIRVGKGLNVLVEDEDNPFANVVGLPTQNIR